MAHRIIPPYLTISENQLLKTTYDINMYEKLVQFVTNLNDSHPMQTIKLHHQQLMNWMIYMTPKLIDTEQFTYNLATRCRWILSGRSDFPICRFCHKSFGMNRNMPIRYDYSEWCSNKCRQTDPIVVARTKATKKRNHGDENYCNVEKAKQTFIDHFGVSNPNKCRSVREKIENTNLVNYGYKCVFKSPIIQEQIRQTNLERRGVASPLSDPIVRAKGILVWIDKYGVDHPSKSPIVREKTKQKFIDHYGVDNNMKSKDGLEYWQTCFKEKYGVINPGQVPEIRDRQRKKYAYDNIQFDSGPELALYIMLKDYNIAFEYQPNEPLLYEHNGKQHLYFPDFKVNGQFIEIKGDQFFDDSGKMICPYRHKKMTDNEYEDLCAAFEAKHQCMLDNNVVILRYKDYKPFLDYVAQKYGKDYLKQFRVQRKKNQEKSEQTLTDLI